MLKLFLLICLTVDVWVDSIPLDEPAIEGHIIGGNDTEITQIPYQVALFVRNIFWCGGIILGPTYILTASYCVMGSRDDVMIVQAGSSIVTYGPEMSMARKIYRHPGFNETTRDYDVAILELEIPLRLDNKTMKAIQLATKEPGTGSVVLASGWVNVLVDSKPLDESVIEGHIVGGNDTDISQVPYQVVMYDGGSFTCGGFIVSPTHVVTAGHCVYLTNQRRVTIRAGSSSNKEGGVVIKAKKIYKNPDFSMNTADYDVSVIELETPLPLNNKTMKAVKLATKEPGTGSVVLVSGWGCINENKQKPKTLQSVTFPVYDRTKCATIYKGYNITITPRMICAGAEGKTAYFGDSGGPVVYKGEVVGIVSFGVGCGKKDLPGVYANIANPEITKFIKDVTKL